MPLASVVVEMNVWPLEKVPPAPVLGAVKVTTTPAPTGDPFDITCTLNGIAYGVPITAFCWYAALAATVMTAFGGAVAVFEVQPVPKARARNSEAITPQYALRIIVSPPYVRLFIAPLRTNPRSS
jgi:hypothetical protein